VSSGSVYAAHARLGDDESAAVLPATDLDVAGQEQYGGAKVACERASAAGAGDRVRGAPGRRVRGPRGHPPPARAPGAPAGPARAAGALAGPMLVPGCPDLATQAVDVRDLAAWLLDCAEAGVTGTYDAVGPVVPFGEWIELSRAAGGHTGPVVIADPAWLR